MSDMVATLWREFAVETEEHFEIIEPLLVASETQAVAPEDISQLFRSFHSVKGLARAMDMRAMETVGHHAENLLGLMRDGVCAFDAAAASLLLEAVDALKALREKAVNERADSDPPAELIARLEQAYAMLSGGGGTKAPASQTHAPKVQVQPQAAPPPRVEAQPPPPAEHAPLGPDPDMLRFYAEMVEQHLPDIARAATSEIDDAGARAAALESLESLEHATSVMGFEGLAAHLADLRRIVENNDAGGKMKAAGILGEIKVEIELLESEIPATITGTGLADRLRLALQSEVTGLIDGMVGVLHRMSDTSGTRVADTDATLAAELAMLARSSCMFFLFLNLHQASRLILMIEDVYGRAAAGELFLHPQILELTHEAVGRLHDVAQNMATKADIDEADVNALLERFRHSLLFGTECVDGADPVSALRRVLANFDISPDLVEILSAENIQDLVAAVHDGHNNLYEILAHFESSEEMTLNFVKWVKAEATAITNRTVFREGKTWFEFLIVSALVPPTVESRIAGIDPSGNSILVRCCKAKAQAGGALATTTPAAVTAVTTAAARAADPKGGAVVSAKATNVLRVRGETVDQLMAQIGEMVTIGNMLHVSASESGVQAALQHLKDYARVQANRPDVMGWVETIEGAVKAFQRSDEQLRSALSRLQDATLELRVVPVETVFNRFPRLVRDLSQALHKQVRLEMEGGEVRIDKAMVESLVDPLMHMVRNAIDHGIEPPEDRQAAGKPAAARLLLRASSRSNRVVIEIIDDGRGLNIERIRTKAVERGLVGAAEAARMGPKEIGRFIFAAGFSTAEQVTETSGRGVGMDVVNTNVLRLGGSVDVETTPGAGSTFTLQLPLSAAIQRVLMVEAGGRMMAIPERFLSEIHQAAAADYRTVKGRAAILLRQSFLPVFRLSELLGFGAGSAGEGSHRSVIVLVNGHQRIGIEVDKLMRRQELFVKEIHPKLASIPGVGGASIAGDGSVVLILDGDDLFRIAERSDVVAATTALPSPSAAVPALPPTIH